MGGSEMYVEPNEAFFASLIKNRQCHCVNCCLYDRDGQVEFIEADYRGAIVGKLRSVTDPGDQ